MCVLVLGFTQTHTHKCMSVQVRVCYEKVDVVDDITNATRIVSHKGEICLLTYHLHSIKRERKTKLANEREGEYLSGPRDMGVGWNTGHAQKQQECSWKDSTQRGEKEPILMLASSAD